jgi:hypothetical protein
VVPGIAGSMDVNGFQFVHRLGDQAKNPCGFLHLTGKGGAEALVTNKIPGAKEWD